VAYRGFRFGVSLITSESRAEWQNKARAAEDLGYDVILVPDHLGMPAPFPSLVAAAQVTTRPHLGTFVLNAGFYKPALLARDVASTDQLVDGRLEVGLGAGYAQQEYEAVGLPFPSAGQRIDYLKHTVMELRQLLADGDHRPPGTQHPTPPLMIAGSGDRLLRLAGEQADIIGLAGVTLRRHTGTSDPGRAALAERIEFIRTVAGDRLPSIELNLMIPAVLLSHNRESSLSIIRQFSPGLTDLEILQLPGVLHGTEHEIAETLHRYRETYGLTYFSVTEQSMPDFAKVISLLR
jgi:probable F420-dependent oxidoreductase